MRVRLTMGALTLLAVALLATPSAFAQTTTLYAIGKPICKQPAKPDMARCFAMRRVVVSKATPGARAFKVADGARPSTSTVGPAGGLTPGGFRHRLRLLADGDGTGQTVALVDAFNDPNINTDLQTFDTSTDCRPAASPTAASRWSTRPVARHRCPPTTRPAGRSRVAGRRDRPLDLPEVQDPPRRGDKQSDSNLATAENEAVKLGATEISNSFGTPRLTSTRPTTPPQPSRNRDHGLAGR